VPILSRTKLAGLCGLAACLILGLGYVFVRPGLDNSRLALAQQTLSFKLMLSTWNGRVLTQNSSGRLDVTVAGQPFGTFWLTLGGRLDFSIPAEAPSEWTLLTGGHAPRHFRAEVVDGLLNISNQDRGGRDVYYFLNPDGSYALDYYQELLYICNQGEPYAPILGRPRRGQRVTDFSAALNLSLCPAAVPLTPVIEPPPPLPAPPGAGPPGGEEDDFGGDYEDVLTGGVRDVELLPPPGEVSEEFNRAIANAKQNGLGYADNRVFPFSPGTDEPTTGALKPERSGMPGLVFQWVYAGNKAPQTWFLPIGADGTLPNGTTWATFLSSTQSGVPLLILLLDFAPDFLAALEPGSHILTYWLEDPDGNKSNIRTEEIQVS